MKHYLCLIFSILFFSLACSYQVDDTVSKNGVLDIHDKKFDDKELYSMQGKWNFQWKNFYSPESFLNYTEIDSTQDSNWQTIQVPSGWYNSETNEKYSKGYGSYHLRAIVPKHIKNISIMYVQLTSAAKIFVNGKEIGQTGQVSTSEKDSEFATYADSVTFENSTDGVLDILIHLSNYDYPSPLGGINEPIYIGSKQAVKTFLMQQRGFEIFFVGAFFIIAFYHLMLFIYNRFDYSTLLFSLFSFDAGIRVFVTGNKVVAQIFPHLSPEIYVRLEYLSWFWGIPLFLNFLIISFNYFNYKKLIIANYMIACIFSLIAIFTPVYVFTQTMHTYQVIFSLQLFFTLFLMYKAYMDKKYGIHLLLLASFLLTLAFLHDVLVAAGTLPKDSFYFAPYGILLFLYAQISLLAQKFYNSFEKSVELTKELKEKNQKFLHFDNMKNELLINISTELKQPLKGILGITESILATEKKITELQRQNILTINHFSKEMLNQINDSLDFTQLIHNNLQVNLEFFDLNKIISLAISMWESRPFDLHILEIKNNIQATHLIYGDKHHLLQNFYNLFHFLSHHCQEKYIEISAESKENNEVVLFFKTPFLEIPHVVSELMSNSENFFEGKGFAINSFQNQEQLFNIVLTTRILSLQSASLKPIWNNDIIEGISINFKSIDSQKDSNFVKEEDGKSRAELADFVAEIENELTAQDKGDYNFFEPTETKFNALIVSSDNVVSSVARTYLQDLKIRSTWVENSKSAFNFLELNSFDILLVDTALDDTSGYEFCQQLRQQYSKNSLPILMMTLSVRMDEIFGVFDSGANDYIHKPFEKNEFLARVNLLLSFKEANIGRKKIGEMEKELKLAKKIQDSLLPKKIPTFDFISFANLYLPMSMIGGDYYDIKRLSENSFSVLVADVSGHGVPAALIASMLKIAIQHNEALADSPAQLLTALNNDLSENLETNFLTAVYAHFDLEKKQVTIARGGHPPVLMVSKNSTEITAIQPHGKLIGFQKNISFEETILSLENGQRFLFYSDGITEINKQGQANILEKEEYGDYQFEKFITMGSQLRAKEFVPLLMEDIFDYSGIDTFDDDLTMVVVDYSTDKK